MQKNRVLIAVIAVLGLASGWYLFRPERLFVNQKVDEALEAGSTANAAMRPPENGSMMAAEKPMAGEPAALLQGRFHSGAHETKGVATIYQFPNGTRTLRLTEFETSNGPDVNVYLVAANDAVDNATVTKAGFVRLASLKGNVGDQNYLLPDDVDLAKYRAVTIWCRRFGVNFGTAPLTTRQS